MSDLREIKSDYWRNRDGSIVHTNNCMYSGGKGAAPWPFADGKARWQVQMLVDDTPWLSLCSRCWPKEST